MTAQFGVGKEHKENLIGDQDEHNIQEDIPVGPEDLDDNWWAAVLEDEPLIDDQIQQQNLPGDDEFLHPEGEQSSSFVDWDRVKTLFAKDEIITLKAVSFNRGGVLVEGADIHGFVPASHLIDLPVNVSENERDQYFSSYLERDIHLKVIECDPEKERIVFSERAALAGAGKRRILLNSLAKGDIVQGYVTNITVFGVFVDLGGLEGLIHVSELSWGRVQHPSMILKLGDEVETMVVEVLADQGRVALSLKRLEKNPWDEVPKQISIGDILDGVITNIVKFGAFARLDHGVEGLIHISNIDFPANCTQVDDLLYEGQAVKVGVISIDAQKRRLGFKLESY
jgi:small subunit ribosomal protein S1